MTILHKRQSIDQSVAVHAWSVLACSTKNRSQFSIHHLVLEKASLEKAAAVRNTSTEARIEG